MFLYTDLLITTTVAVLSMLSLRFDNIIFKFNELTCQWSLTVVLMNLPVMQTESTWESPVGDTGVGWHTFSNAIAMEKVYQPTLFSPTSGGFIKIYIEKGTT